MAESCISRLAFPRGLQKQFITRCLTKLDTPLYDIAQRLGISVRTLMDWRREKFLISQSAARLLSKKSGIPIPKNAHIKKAFWSVKKAAKKGGRAVYKKYGRVGGSETERLKSWYEWWNTKGKFNHYPIFEKLPIREPKKSAALAEFVGIILGDGGITKHQVTITLHHIDDKAYGKFVAKLIKNLFGITPSIYHSVKYSVNNYVVSRSRLVEFCTQKLGLKMGNKVKHQIDIPSWIKENRKFYIACVRGLVDTDGSVFTHRYKVNKKQYAYKKLDFCSMSAPLRNSVYSILKEIELHPRLKRNKIVRLNSIRDMERYFSIVGTHNPKHLKRYTATPIL